MLSKIFLELFSSMPAPSTVLTFLKTMPVSSQAALAFLLLLSIAAWSIIFAKCFLLQRVRHSNQKFKSRLRGASSCLDVFLSGDSFPRSPFYCVYETGARTITKQMLGTDDRSRISERDIEEESLDVHQYARVGTSMRKSLRECTDQMRHGFAPLRLIAAVSAVVGLAVGSWLVIQSISAHEGKFHTLLSCALIVVVWSLLVSFTSGLSQGYLFRLCQAQARKASAFSEEVYRSFESLCPPPIPQPQASTSEPAAASSDVQYRSLTQQPS